MRQVAVLFTLLLVLASCSLLESDDARSPVEPSRDGLAFTDANSPDTVPEALRDRGGVLRMGIVGTTWADPAAIDETLLGEQQVADLLFDGLTQLDRRGDPVPAVASSWIVSPNELIWTFSLDNAAVFSDGSLITASDVQHSLKRVIARGVESIAGNRLQVVAEVGAPSRFEVVIELNQPFSPLAELLSAPIFGIVPVEGGDEVITSAQDFVARAEGAELRLTPTAEFQGYVDELSIRFFESDDRAAAAFAAGALDISPANDVEGSQVVPGSSTTLFLMNLGDPTFASSAVRQAIVLSIDPAFIAAGRDESTTVSVGLVPVHLRGGAPDPCADCGYRPDESRAILAGLSADEVPVVYVDHLADPGSTATAETLVSDLVYVGFDARLRSHSPTAFAAKLAAGDLGLFQFGTSGSWSSPEAYLGELFETGGADNVASFSDPQVDRLLVQARGELDGDLRRSLYLRVESRILELAVVVPLFETDQQILVSSRVSGFRQPSFGAFDTGTAWLIAG